MIVLGWWLIPTAVTAFCLWMMLRPVRDESGGGLWNFDLTPVFRALWLIPLLGAWAVYFGVMLLTKE